LTLLADIEVFVANHIDKNHRLQIIQLPVTVAAVDVVAAAVNAVLIGPFDNGFFAIKENKFESIFELQPLCRACKLQQPRRARTSVIGSGEKKSVEDFRVIVARKCDDCGFQSGTHSPDVHHVAESLWCTGVEFIQLRFESRLGQFRNDIASRFCQGLASRGPRSKADNRSKIRVRPLFAERRAFQS